MTNKLYEFFMWFYSFCFARRCFLRLNRLLFAFSLRGLGILNAHDSKISGEEHFLNKILPKLIDNDKPILFDVGANVGNFTRILKSRFPEAEIYSFEPHPENYKKLNEIESVNSLNIGFGKEKGSLKLYDRADQNGTTHATLFKEVISDIYKWDVTSTEVEIDTLDNFTEKNSIETIDFLKLDTEGNELPILKGAETLISGHKIGCIFFEFNEMNVISRSFIRDFRIVLKDYVFYRLLPKGIILLDDSSILTELFAYQNIIAVPSDKINRLN